MWLSRPRNRASLPAAALVMLLVVGPPHAGIAQNQPTVRRALPVGETPVPRALPVESAAPAASGRPAPPQPNDINNPPGPPGPPPPAETEAADRRPLAFATALYGRKLFDLAVPEFEKYLEDYPDAPGQAQAQFFLGESYRALNRQGQARKSFQAVLDRHGDSEYGGAAAYILAETAFTEKNYAAALPLFHRAATKAKEPAVTLSAHYFEARCLETLDRKDEACGIYLQIAEAKNPNPYREDSRLAAASILLSRGKKADALKQYDALANEAQKPALKAEAQVRGGLIAIDLTTTEKGKTDKGMLDHATSLLQKARGNSEAGKFRAIAVVALLRLSYQTGQFAQVLADYKKEQQKLPEEARPESMLLAGNSERQLGHTSEADAIYADLIAKYPKREEAKDAQYQRLINIYNSDPGRLFTAVDDFLASNPSVERADQAKLLKAEALYQQQKYEEAAPVYADLRASQLSSKLRAEAAYKLGWCYVQLKDLPRTVEAFSYFIQAFPDNSQTPAALAQRALAYQQDKNYDVAIADLNTILGKYPTAREREAALQQKALILGQQGNAKGMSDTFRQLLKEFPKSAAAAQAQYYIGKANLDLKDYKAAITALGAARQLDKTRYYDAATIRIITAYFALHDRNALTKELDAFLAAKPDGSVPAEVLETVGLEFYNEKNYPAAEKYLSALVKNSNATTVKPDLWFYLGDAESRLNKFPEAEDAYSHYLQAATDPAGKAKALLSLGATKISAHKPDEAQKIAEEIMTLQPEGRVNAEARLLAGDVQVERGNFDEAGKSFMSVALLYDDPAITPRALQKAASAYQRAGKPDEAGRASQQLHERYPNQAEG